MRLNALISAPLALALLSSGHTLLAQPHSARHSSTHRAGSSSAYIQPVTKKRRNRKSGNNDAATSKHGSSRHKRKRHQVSDDPAPVTVERVDSTSHTHEAPMLQASARTDGDLSAKPRKATSDDFLKAAGVHDANMPQASGQVAAAPASDSSETEDTADATHDSQPSGKPSPPASSAAAARPASLKPHLDSVEQEAATPVILPVLYNKRGRLIVPPPLRGSHEILVRQNLVANREGLDRIQDDDDLARMRAQRLLVPIPVSGALDVDDRLPANRRFTRPWTAQFLATLARAHYARFHTPLQVNSAVRTVEFQQRLLRTNGNAAPAEGETASPHLTGQAIDLAKHGLSLTEIAWLRGYLLPLSQQGRIDVEEEFQQACFHISVYKKYLPSAAPKRLIAGAHYNETTALAAAIH